MNNGYGRFWTSINLIKTIGKIQAFFVIIIVGIVCHIAHPVQIGTSTKRFSSSPQNNNFHLVILLDSLKHFDEFCNHHFIKSIVNFRSVEPDDSDFIFYFKLYCFIIFHIKYLCNKYFHHDGTMTRCLFLFSSLFVTLCICGLLCLRNYILKIPYFVSSHFLLSDIAIPIASTLRVSTGSIIPSSHMRAVL